ncbi:hypothetical protein M1146_03695, partial [Patescibacteria group bacterium]|nr:hypothetical protein [Patescibacteria group bacterium]
MKYSGSGDNGNDDDHTTTKRLLSNLSLRGSRDDTHRQGTEKPSSLYSPSVMQDLERYTQSNDFSPSNHHANEKMWHAMASKWIKENINWDSEFYFDLFDPLNVDHYSAMLEFAKKKGGIYYGANLYDQCVFVFMACKAIDPPLSDLTSPTSAAKKVFEIASVLTVRILKPFQGLTNESMWEVMDDADSDESFPDEFTESETLNFNQHGDMYDEFMKTVDLTCGGKNMAYIVASKTDETKYARTSLSQGLRFIACLFLNDHKQALNIDGIASWCISNISLYILVEKFGFKSVFELKDPKTLTNPAGKSNILRKPVLIRPDIINPRPLLIKYLWDALTINKNRTKDLSHRLEEFRSHVNLMKTLGKEEPEQRKELETRINVLNKQETLLKYVRTTLRKFYTAYMTGNFIPPKTFEEIFPEIQIADATKDESGKNYYLFGEAIIHVEDLRIFRHNWFK